MFSGSEAGVGGWAGGRRLRPHRPPGRRRGRVSESWGYVAEVEGPRVSVQQGCHRLGTLKALKAGTPFPARAHRWE